MNADDKIEIQKQLDKAALLYADSLRTTAELSIWKQKIVRQLKEVEEASVVYKTQVEALDKLLAFHGDIAQVDKCQT